MVTSHSPHPFDPITPEEIKLAVRILEATFPGVELRYKRIDVNEPIKKDVIAYIEAERLRRPLPTPPARLLYVLFHRLDTGAFYKAILNADKRTIVYAKELPKEVQVSGALLQIVRDQLTVFFYRDQLMSTKLQPLKKCA
jgi:primary-amine oxidase